MGKRFNIDIFELMFLAESVIPPCPIARNMAFKDFSEVHYHKMTDAEREQFFEVVNEQDRFSLDDEDCRHFYARFNPDNQYLIQAEYKGKKETHHCYYYKGRYHTSKTTSILEDYIIDVKKKGDAKKT